MAINTNDAKSAAVKSTSVAEIELELLRKRADIANDLLAALETIYSQTNDGLARRVAGDALARYRALAD